MRLSEVSWSLDQQQKLPGDGGKPISLRNEDSSKLEDLDQYTLLELKPPGGRTPGIHLEGVDSEPEIQNGQCGLTRLWVPTGQRTVQGLTFLSVQWGNPIASKFLGLPREGANADSASFEVTKQSLGAP